MNALRPILLSLLLLCGVGGSLYAADAVTQQTRLAVAGEQYGKPPGGLFFFGQDYRDLWTTPVQVEVLDLQGVAGGLRPVTRVGGNSTKGLALKGADGRDYTFRSVNKDLSRTVPVEFQDSVLVDIVQDQIAANIPGVQVVIPPMAHASGVLTVDEARLVVLPDDAALGEFRGDFAGVLGIFLEYPQPRSATHPGFHGATEILSPQEFWNRYQAAPDVRPNTQELLRARLFDMFINDYDRHRGQWRWARIPGESTLHPIPEDPDMAFTDYEGAALSLARLMGAPFVKFEGEYPPLASITKNGWDMDRVLLTNIEKAEWMRIAADLQSKLTDAVIEGAIGRLPVEYYNLRGGELIANLKSRRDRLQQYAERFYQYMAEDVDVHGTDANDLAHVEWLAGGDLLVTVANLNEDGSAPQPFYGRRFLASETKEVRIYLHGGDDRVITRGHKVGGLKVRAIGGPGNDIVDDTQGGGVRFYDSEGNNAIEGDNGTRLDSRSFTMPSRPLPNDVTWAPNPDWGRMSIPVFAVAYAGDPGLIVGAGFDTKGRGFRKYPWSTSHTFEGAWATGVSKPFVDYVGAFRRQNSSLHFALNARFSGIEQLRYYGLGNETDYDSSRRETYEISDYQTEIFPAIVLSNDKGSRFAIGPYLQYSDSSGTDPETVLGQEQPRGFGKFGHVGFRTEAAYDSREPDDVFARGIEVRAKGKYSPRAWDAQQAFGSIDGRFAAHLPTGSRLVWNFFAGGKKVWGGYPFFEAAYVENRTTTGYNWNRFAGDAALYGGASLDVILGKMRNVVPGDVGVSFFTDVGRVYLSGEDSSKWHPAYGAGVFYAPFRRTSLYGLKVGVNDDRWFVQLEMRMRGFGL
jgi:hypothetical protein